MNKVPIKKHHFEKAKGNIERFSRNLPSNPSFDRVEVEGGLFGLGDHKVTGSEMNKFIGKVQDKLISINTSLRSVISQFKEVYNAFDFLDGEYISGIISSVESAEEASKQALSAQADIKATVENLKKTVVKLGSLKNTVECLEKKIDTLFSNELSYDEITRKLDNDYKIKQIPSLQNKLSSISAEINKTKELFSLIERQKERNDALNRIYSQLSSNLHYKDIDVIWSNVEKQKTDLVGIHQQLDAFIENVNQAIEQTNNDIAALQQYHSILESYEHIGDIDNIWSDVKSHKVNLASIHQQLDAFIENVNRNAERIINDIITLQQYHSVLESYKHLDDVDAIWNSVESHKVNLAGLHEQLDNFISENRTAYLEIKESIKELEEANTTQHLKYETKIKIAYYIGGGAVSLSLINYILQILGIL